MLLNFVTPSEMLLKKIHKKAEEMVVITNPWLLVVGVVASYKCKDWPPEEELSTLHPSSQESPWRRVRDELQRSVLNLTATPSLDGLLQEKERFLLYYEGELFVDVAHAAKKKHKPHYFWSFPVPKSRFHFDPPLNFLTISVGVRRLMILVETKKILDFFFFILFLFSDFLIFFPQLNFQNN